MKKQSNKNIDLKLLAYNIKNQKALYAVYSILLFISYPLAIIIRKINSARDTYYSGIYDALEPYSIVTVPMLLALATPFIVFSYINSKKSVDVYHALPVKRKSLFMSHAISSLLLVLIPFTLNYFLGYLLNFAFGYNFENIELLHYVVYIIMLIGIHGLPLFVMMNTGTLGDGLIHTGIFILLPFVAYAAFNTFFQTYVFGASYLPWENYKYLTPLVALFQPMTYEPESLTKLSFYWIVMNIILYIATSQLYTIRKSEKSEEPFVNDKYFPIITTLFIPLFFILMNVTTRSFSSSNNALKDFFSVESYLLPFGLAFVGYMILNFFRYRSTKYFMKTLMKYIIIMGVTTVTAMSVIFTNGFGVGWRIPKTSDIQSISLSPTQLHNNSPIFSPNDEIYTAYNQKVHLIDEDAIRKFVDIHEEVNAVLKKHRNDESELIKNSIIQEKLYCEQDYFSNFAFTYHLKNGRKVEKELNIPQELILNFAQIIDEPNYQIIMNPILNQDLETKRVTLYNNIMSQELTNLSQDQTQKLKDAYLKDIENLSSEDLMFKASKLKYIIKYQTDFDSFTQDTQGVSIRRDYRRDTDNYLYIDERFSQSLNYLDTLEFKPKDRVLSYSLIEPNLNHEKVQESQSFCGMIMRNYAYDMPETSLDKVEALQDKVEGSYIRKTSSQALLIDDTITVPIAP